MDKLFVGGLNAETSVESLVEYFGTFGEVTRAKIHKSPRTQRSRGFGFVTFAHPNAVANVLRESIHCLDGNQIEPKHAIPQNRKDLIRTKKMFVGGVSWHTSSDEVEAYFSQFGKIKRILLVMNHETKRHRGFGFVTFENEDVVDGMCSMRYHWIGNKWVECKKHRSIHMEVTSRVTNSREAAAAAAQNAAVHHHLLNNNYPNQSGTGTSRHPLGNQACSLAYIDTSCFQCVNWSSMYGMGMYI